MLGHKKAQYRKMDQVHQGAFSVDLYSFEDKVLHEQENG